MNKSNVLFAGLACLFLAGSVFFGVTNVQNSKKFEKEQSVYEDQIDSLQQCLSEREKAVAAAMEDLEQMNQNYTEDMSRIEGKLQDVQKRYRATLSELERLESPELEEYFYQRYSEECGWEEDRFTLPIEVGNKVRYDLTDRDFCIEESELKDSVMLEQARYIDTLNLVADRIYAERNYLTGKISTLEQYGTDLENQNLLLEKNLKCQKVQKGVFITTTTILGILLAVTLIGGTR